MLAAANNAESAAKKRPLSSFIRKLWYILTDKAFEEFIFWVDNGQVICIPNCFRFSQAILPKFFKHNNWQSFVRQLNLYGFRKVYQLNLSYDDTVEKRSVWHFKHYNFQKNKPEKLFDIKRRTNKSDQEPMQEECREDNSPSSPPIVDHQSKLEKELNDCKERLNEVDEKRQYLLRQVIQLNKVQSNQREAIKVLSDTILHILNNNPNINIKEKAFAEIVEKLLEVKVEEIPPQEEEISELEDDEIEDDDDDYMDVENFKNSFYSTQKVNYSNYIPTNSLPKTSSSDVLSTRSFQSQNQILEYHSTATLSRTLPPIRTLFHSPANETLPPIKRRKAV